jgi:hypothetical protein
MAVEHDRRWVAGCASQAPKNWHTYVYAVGEIVGEAGQIDGQMGLQAVISEGISEGRWADGAVVVGEGRWVRTPTSYHVPCFICTDA